MRTAVYPTEYFISAIVEGYNMAHIQLNILSPPKLIYEVELAQLANTKLYSWSNSLLQITFTLLI